LTAKLVEKELRPLEEMRLGPFGGPREMDLDVIPRDMNDKIRRLEVDRQRIERPFPGQPFPDGEFFNRRVPGANLLREGTTFTWDDGSLTLTLTNRGGKRHLLAKDKTGKVLHDGPASCTTARWTRRSSAKPCRRRCARSSNPPASSAPAP
jgi:hypothetical protein